jgi:hypothetical protein
VDPFPNPLLIVAPGIKPGPLDLQPRTLTTRPQRRQFADEQLMNMFAFHISQIDFLAYYSPIIYFCETPTNFSLHVIIPKCVSSRLVSWHICFHCYFQGTRTHRYCNQENSRHRSESTCHVFASIRTLSHTFRIHYAAHRKDAFLCIPRGSGHSAINLASQVCSLL